VDQKKKGVGVFVVVIVVVVVDWWMDFPLPSAVDVETLFRPSRKVRACVLACMYCHVRMGPFKFFCIVGHCLHMTYL